MSLLVALLTEMPTAQKVVIVAFVAAIFLPIGRNTPRGKFERLRRLGLKVLGRR